MLRIIQLLRGKKAATFRQSMADLLEKYLDADMGLADDMTDDNWLSSDFFYDTTIEQFAYCVQQALLLLWTQNDFVKGRGREPSPKTLDMFKEFVNNFVTTELKKNAPGTGSQSTPAVPESSQAAGKETAVPGGMPAADTTAGPSGMELDSTEPAETGLPQAIGAVKASAHATRRAAAATAAVPHDKPFDFAVENAGHNDSAQEKLLKLVVNSDIPPAEKMAMSAAIMARYHARTPAKSHLTLLPKLSHTCKVMHAIGGSKRVAGQCPLLQPSMTSKLPS
ncbi:hypothetical protein ABBQ32_14188 [Trebouxia sp. C0010 RCD-2024]